MFHIIFIENINIITTPPAHHIWTYLNTRKSHISVCPGAVCSLFLLHSILVLLPLYSVAPPCAHRVMYIILSYNIRSRILLLYTWTCSIRKLWTEWYAPLVRWCISVRPILYLNFVEWERVTKLLKKEFFSSNLNQIRVCSVYVCVTVCNTTIRICKRIEKNLFVFILWRYKSRGNPTLYTFFIPERK